MKLKTLLKTVLETRYNVIDEGNNFTTYGVYYLDVEENKSMCCKIKCHSMSRLPDQVLDKKVKHITINTATGLLEILV